MRCFTPRRPWVPLSDAGCAALAPHLPRAARLLGMAGLLLARRLGLLTALPMVPWRLPDRRLSEALFRLAGRVLVRVPERWPRPGLLARLGRALAVAGGRAVWSKKFAPL